MSTWNYIKGNIAIEYESKNRNLTKTKNKQFIKDIKDLFEYNNEKYRYFAEFKNWYKEENIVPYGSEEPMNAFVNFITKEEDRKYRTDALYIQLHGNFRDTDEEDVKHMKKYCKDLIFKFYKVANKYNIRFFYTDIDINVSGRKVKLNLKDWKKIWKLEE